MTKGTGKAQESGVQDETARLSLGCRQSLKVGVEIKVEGTPEGFLGMRNLKESGEGRRQSPTEVQPEARARGDEERSHEGNQKQY